MPAYVYIRQVTVYVLCVEHSKNSSCMHVCTFVLQACMRLWAGTFCQWFLRAI